MATGRRLRAGLMVLGVSVAVGSCGGQKPAGEIGIVGPHTPAPPDAITDPKNASQRGLILRFANTLEFADPTDDSTHLYHGQWDRALVDTLGDTAIVEPEVNIHRTDDPELQRGRIQMRIVLLVGRPGRTPQQIYDALKVPPGVSYVWVDSLKMDSPTHGKARVVVIPADSSLEARERTVDVYRNPRAIWNRAVARWTPFQCWSCVKPGGWCEG